MISVVCSNQVQDAVTACIDSCGDRVHRHRRRCSSSFIAMSSLPPELWMEVMDYLPTRDLISLSSTSRLLRALGLKAIFRNVTVWAHEDGPARLAFYTSQPIAPLIQCITIAVDARYLPREH